MARALFLILSLLITPLCAEEKIAVVLMHGKWGTALPKSPIGPLAKFLEQNGFIVSTPEMPWSRERRLDKSYEDAMLEIDMHVNKLRSEGISKIIVGGHSMGANAALGYGARHAGLAGILAIAPGHVPELNAYQNKIDHDWQRAQQMVDAGNGSVITRFNDLNQGNVSGITVPANIYLSWYKPKGPAVIPANTAQLKPGTPLLWIIGEDDIMVERGKEYAFNSAPDHPMNTYIVVKGGHKATPRRGKSEIHSWLQNL